MMNFDVNSVQRVYQVKDMFGNLLYYQGNAYDGSFIDYIPQNVNVANKIVGSISIFKNVSMEQAKDGTKKAKIILNDGKTVIIDETENLIEEARQFFSNPSFRMQCIRNIDSKKINLFNYLVSSFSKFANVPIEEIPQYQAFQNYVTNIYFACKGTHFCEKISETYSVEQKERLVGRVLEVAKTDSIIDRLKAIGGKIGSHKDKPSTGLKM